MQHNKVPLQTCAVTMTDLITIISHNAYHISRGVSQLVKSICLPIVSIFRPQSCSHRPQRPYPIPHTFSASGDRCHGTRLVIHIDLIVIAIVQGFSTSVLGRRHYHRGRNSRASLRERVSDNKTRLGDIGPSVGVLEIRVREDVCRRDDVFGQLCAEGDAFCGREHWLWTPLSFASDGAVEED